LRSAIDCRRVTSGVMLVTWWIWALLAWGALAVPVAVLVGRSVSVGQGSDAPRPAGDPRLPAQRDGDDAADDLSA